MEQPILQPVAGAFSIAAHGIRNLGSDMLKVVGFFTESEIVSTFAEPVQPIGLSSMTQGAPVPA